MKPLSKLVIVILFFIAGNAVLGQELSNFRWISQDTTTGSVQVVADWQKGEKKKFRAYKFDNRYQGDSLVSEKKILDCIVEFAVMDSTTESYSMTFKMLENKMTSSAGSDLRLEQLNIRDEDLTLRYSTDANGTFAAFKNRTEVEGKLDELMNLIKQKQKEQFKAKNEAEKKVFATVLDQMANGKILFGTMFETFIAQVHGIHGYRTGINDTLFFNETVPHPMVNRPIQFDCYLYVAALDTLGMVQFDTEKFADMEQFSQDYVAFINKTRQDSGLKPDKKLDDQVGTLNMEMETYSSIVLDLNSGWPTYLKLSRVITAKAAKEETAARYEVWELDSDLEYRVKD
ncbi:hypothetical protein SAMN04487996_10989 [Dyadobacter soli]|uniref:Uncharacterized protein n=1 Tax=Dyadobacter soli TaxID=659014 RepID=A0A1G7IST4_9BACT|nr:hypothetical protein [Dyadobacter soli]SDF15792.1 hypothetical protein SAMN04487996_10989 [Dyadobacter soli]